MELSELLRFVASTLERLGIPYLVTGSMATIAYGEPRLTNDIDLVVRLSRHQVRPLFDAFPEESFYLSPQAALEAVERCGQFHAPGSQRRPGLGGAVSSPRVRR